MRILIIRYSALGDVLLTTGVIRYLKKQRPDLDIDILTSPQLKELFSGIPSINEVYTLSKGASFSEIKKCYKELPSYEHIFDLHGKLKTKLIGFFSKGQYHKIHNLSLQRRLFVQTGRFRSQLNKHVVEKYAQTCFQHLGINMPSKEELRPFLPQRETSKLLPSDIEKYIVIHPYASQKNKIWPFFDQLIERLLAQNEKVVIVGQGQHSWPKEAIDLSNQSSLTELISIMSGASRVITTDSGPMHIAVALDKPTHTFFGPTTKEFGFYPEFKNCFVLENNSVNCRPCHVHGGNTCPKTHFNCMRSLSVESILTQIQKSSVT